MIFKSNAMPPFAWCPTTPTRTSLAHRNLRQLLILLLMTLFLVPVGCVTCPSLAFVSIWVLQGLSLMMSGMLFGYVVHNILLFYVSLYFSSVCVGCSYPYLSARQLFVNVSLRLGLTGLSPVSSSKKHASSSRSMMRYVLFSVHHTFSRMYLVCVQIEEAVPGLRRFQNNWGTEYLLKASYSGRKTYRSCKDRPGSYRHEHRHGSVGKPRPGRPQRRRLVSLPPSPVSTSSLVTRVRPLSGS